ncbi:preprotein translocase subunit SecA [Candidatus Wolfebacteria bacterium]|nr:MAG: preprotein translocase subunit SecA [Candidatus Wolfebacteria bacterium]
MSIFNFKRIFGDKDSWYIKSLKSRIEEINSLESEFTSLSDEDFPKKTKEFKDRLEKGETLDDILVEAYALVRESTKRTLQQSHYDVQLIGGIALHEGKIAEMRTGEGKTLVATLPAYLHALEGKGVHVITVNDYLARRDADWMGQIYNFLGLSVGVINDQNTSYIYDESTKEELDEARDEEGFFKIFEEYLKPTTRRAAYDADITYGTNNQFGFDYLRDNLIHKKEDLVQREHHYVIVDEVDSILIDEARTPLIISAPAAESEDFYTKFSSLAKQLHKESDYEVDEKLRAISLTDKGIEKAENLLGVDNIYTEKGIKYVHHLETAVRAQALFEKDKDYVVNDGEVVIVDSFTGRLQPGRRYSEGLHQALEAKEGVTIQKETRTVASITFQNYFRFYKTLSGMTGTAKTSAEELYKVYGLDVVSIPTHRPIGRVDNNDLIFQTEQGKYRAIAQEVKARYEKGQPVLIGTISIEKNELLSAYLTQEGVPHKLLNAKNHEKEGEITAGAGEKGSVVIATNMAGRGVDIKLGGINSTEEQYEEVKNLGGLFVLGTERHDARRIDDQLRGRAGRQGDQGETQFFVSLEDDLMRIFGSERIKTMMGRFGIPEDQPIENRFITKALESSQEKIEGFNFDARKHTLEYDELLNNQRNIIYKRRRMILMSEQSGIKSYLETLIEDRDDIKKIVKERIEDVGEEGFYVTVQRIVLYVTDLLWVEHLETMDYLRSSVNLRAYGQRDPLVEYKKEGLQLFRQLEFAFEEQVFSLISNIKRAPIEESHTGEQDTLQESHQSKGQFAGNSPQSQNKPQAQPQPVQKNESKIGRNDPCPCGAINPHTGKCYKYKKCGLINAPHHKG